MTEQEENRMRANIIQRAYDAGREAQLQIQTLQEEIAHLRAELEKLRAGRYENTTDTGDE